MLNIYTNDAYFILVHGEKNNMKRLKDGLESDMRKGLWPGTHRYRPHCVIVFLSQSPTLLLSFYLNLLLFYCLFITISYSITVFLSQYRMQYLSFYVIVFLLLFQSYCLFINLTVFFILTSHTLFHMAYVIVF
jgi:hypothetical protein